jgi:hypothetical protein
MDDAEIRRAIEEADRCEREFKLEAIRAAQRERAEREQRDYVHEAEQRAVREWLARSANDEETFVEQVPQRSGLQHYQYMSDEVQKVWDDWLSVHLNNWAELIGDELGKVIGGNYRELKAEIKQMRDELEKLRARVGEDDNVVPLIPLKGGRRDAA